VAGYAVLSALFCSRIFSWTNLRASGLMSGDPGLNAWALGWVSHALTTAPFQIMNGNAFYPAHASIALSEHMFSLALLNVLFRPFSESPWFGYNLLIFLAYLLSCTGAYRLTAQLTGSRAVAVFGGVFWGFLFFRIHHLGHLQILSFQWIPYSLLYLLRLTDEGGAANAAKLALFVALQSLTSWYLAAINVVVLFTVLLFFVGRRHLSVRFVALLAAVALAVGLVTSPFVPAYLEQAKSSSLRGRMLAVQGSGDLVHLADYLTPPKATWIGSHIEGNKYWIWQENTLFVGYVPLALAVLGIGAVIVQVWRRQSGGVPRLNARATGAGVALVAVGYVLALGFISRDWGVRLPLDFAARAMPFLYGLRATQRFSLVTDMGVLLLAAQGGLWLVGRLRSSAARRSVIGILCAAYLFEVFPYVLPFRTDAPFEFDRTDRSVRSLQRSVGRSLVVLHLPIFYFRQAYPTSETRYMVGSTMHWAKIVNGFSGEVPDGFMDRMRVLNTFPSPESWTLLRDLGVDLVALHPEISPEEQNRMTTWAAERGSGAAITPSPNERILLLCFGASAQAFGCH
jgi:hypothetical protein